MQQAIGTVSIASNNNNKIICHHSYGDFRLNKQIYNDCFKEWYSSQRQNYIELSKLSIIHNLKHAKEIGRITVDVDIEKLVKSKDFQVFIDLNSINVHDSDNSCDILFRLNDEMYLIHNYFYVTETDSKSILNYQTQYFMKSVF